MRSLVVRNQSNGKHRRTLNRGAVAGAATHAPATSHAKNDANEFAGVGSVRLRNEDLGKAHDIHRLGRSGSKEWRPVKNVSGDNRIARADRVTRIDNAIRDEGILPSRVNLRW